MKTPVKGQEDICWPGTIEEGSFKKRVDNTALETGTGGGSKKQNSEDNKKELNKKEKENQNETPKRRTATSFLSYPGSSSFPMVKLNWRSMLNTAAAANNSSNRRITPTTMSHGHRQARNSSESSSSGSSGSSKLGRFILTSSSSGSSSVLSCASNGFALESDLKGMNLMNQTNLILKNNDDEDNDGDFDLSSSSRCFPIQRQGFTGSADQEKFSTPNRTSCSSSRHNPCLNPFESDLIETINCSSLTPSVFSKVLTPSKYECSDVFSWGVDNVAVLYPAEIEVNPHQDTSRPVDVEMEERLQHAINSFFAQKSFAPSPWLDDNDGPRPGPTLRLSPSHPPHPHSRQLDTDSGDVGTSEGEKPKLEGFGSDEHPTKDVWCQTVLSLPVNLELDPALAKYFTFHEDQSEQVTYEDDNEEEEENREPLESDSRDGSNLSSLRRKLFANMEELPSTPLKMVEGGFVTKSIPSPDVSIMTSPIIVTASSPLVTKDLEQRTDMTPRNDIASPTMSPISCLVSKSEDDTDDVSFMSIGRSRTNTPIVEKTRTSEICAPFYFDDLGILRLQDSSSSYERTTDKMIPSLLHTRGQEGGTIEAKQRSCCSVRVALPSYDSPPSIAGSVEVEERVAAAKSTKEGAMLFMDVTCHPNHNNNPSDLGYQTMSSSQESAGRSLIVGGVPLLQRMKGVGQSPPPPKTDADPVESSVSNTSSSSAMMWSPIGSSTPSSAARYAASATTTR